MSEEYEIVERLRQTVKNLKLSIKASPEKLKDDGHFYQRVQFSCEDTVIHFPFMDEFSDIEKENPVVLLHFILAECVFFEEAEDFQEWCKDMGLRENRVSSAELYEELSEKVPQIRSIVGHKIEPVPGFDIELNTGIAKALRASRI